jgi:tetratricopeptide (TPR) repeat protein
MADLALLSAKLRQACLALAHRSVYASAPQSGFTDIAIHYISSTGLIDKPAIGLYYYCYFMLKEPARESFFKAFKKLLFRYNDSFPLAETRELHLMGINYCIQQVNQGAESYFEDIMSLYQKGLAEGYLLENGVLSRFTYYNIVAAGLRTGQFEWTENFIHDYRGKLDKFYRESSFSFCLARLEYAQQHYDAALPLLQKANYQDPLLNLSAKTLLMKIYYETEELDLLSAHLDAMHNYIRRKRVIGYHKTNYLNIIRFARKLMSVNPFDKQALEKLRQQIGQEEVLTERRWLSAQLVRPDRNY